MLKEWFFHRVGISRWYEVKDGAIRYVTKYTTKSGQD